MPTIQQPPKANKIPFTREIHGQILTDNYHWLRDESRAKPEVLQLIEDENKYTESVLEDSKKLKAEIFQEMIERYNTEPEEIAESAEPGGEEEISYTQIGDWLYWEKVKNTDDQYETRYRKKVGSDSGEVVLDLNEFSKQYEYFNLHAICYSPDRNYLLFVVDLQGLEIFTTFILDVNSKTFLEKLLEGALPIWLCNSKAFYYMSSDDHGKFRWCAIKKHIVRTDQKMDEVIHYEAFGENTLYLDLSKSTDEKFIYLERTSDKSTEYLYVPYDQPEAEFKTFSPLVLGEQYKPFYANGYFYIICNIDNAINFKLMKTAIDRTEKQYWQEIIPHKEDTYFTTKGMEELVYFVKLFKDFLAFRVFQNGKQKIMYVNTTTDEVKEIKLDADLPFYELELWGDLNSSVLKLSIQSYYVPTKVYEFNLITEELKFISQDKFKGFNQELYSSELAWATSPEGVKIPISLFYRKDLFKKDGTNSFFLDAYGAAGAYDPEWFESKRLSIVDRGFVFGVAHVRGGGYLGKKWHLDGIGRNRINRFKDYITCSEYLIKEKYTSSDKLVACGNSAGGQIMGAILNMRPDLYKCVLAIVPGVDVVNVFYDKGWQGAIAEKPEEGDIENKEDFESMLARDMYYQIKPTKFPHVFTTTGLYDSRAYFWRPVKWFCKLREFNTGNNIQILKTENTGHWSGTDKYSDENHFAELYAFAIWALGK